MSKRYFCNVSECIKLMLTPGTRNKNKENRIDNKKVAQYDNWSRI